jgi:hypothetical protein
MGLERGNLCKRGRLVVGGRVGLGLARGLLLGLGVRPATILLFMVAGIVC